jgi:cytochrome c oxidase cbb3-type subunit 2
MRGALRTALVATAALLGVVPAAEVSPQSRDLSTGRRVYADNCAVCHGVDGDGRGHAAQHFTIPPRDFTGGRYKIRSTGSGQLPTDDDLRRSIARGVPGTGMVPQDHLSDEEMRAVIELIKSLSPRFAAGPPPTPLPIPPEPARSGDTIARGRKVYEKAECQECHGREGRGDGASAKDLKIKPVDLNKRPFKGGSTPRDIFRAMITGLDGTPMPSYHLVLDDGELWDLAHYVASLGGAPEVTRDEREGWHVVHMHQKRNPR